MPATRWMILPICVLLLASCGPIDPRLGSWREGYGYRFDTLQGDGGRDPDETFVMVTLSGGGTRAAAFAYGALRGLRQIPIGDGRSLLDEVDVLSGVSGGSFAATYLGAFGPERFFERFPDDMLHRRLQWSLITRLLAPWNWVRLLSPRFSRTDLAAEFYDRAIFDGKTYGDLPHHRPFVLLNATDLGRGAQFAFSQEHFDRLCADLSPVPLAYGVTASSAFPVAFPPVTLENYGAASCGFPRPPWVAAALEGHGVGNEEQFDLARTWRSYESREARPWIHLSDGGIADNLGLRQLESELLVTGSWDLLRKINDGTVKRIIVIAVDAKPGTRFDADECARPPGFVSVLNVAASKPMENYSSDTVARVRELVETWSNAATAFDVRVQGCEALAAGWCPGRDPSCTSRLTDSCRRHLRATETFRVPSPQLQVLHVRFDAVPDGAARRRLKAIPTGLQLDREDVDLLIEWGERLVRDSPLAGSS